MTCFLPIGPDIFKEKVMKSKKNEIMATEQEMMDEILPA